MSYIKKIPKRLFAVIYCIFAILRCAVLGCAVLYESSMISDDFKTVFFNRYNIAIFSILFLTISIFVSCAPMLIIAFKNKAMPKLTIATSIWISANAVIVYLIPPQTVAISTYVLLGRFMYINFYRYFSFLFSNYFFTAISVICVVFSVLNLKVAKQ